jgi:hypothetical protein
MAVISRTTYIEAPVDSVFDYLIDVERHVEWSGELSFGLETLKKVTAGPLNAGSVFKSTGRLSSKVGVEDTSTVTEIMPPRYLAWDTVSSGALQENTFSWAYTFEPRREGTRLTYSLEARHFSPKPIQLWFPPLLWLVDRKIFGREMESALRRIKIAMEK